MPSSSYGTSEGSSGSDPNILQSSQSEWGLQLSQMLSALGTNQLNWARGEYNRGMQFTGDNINRYLQVSGNAAELATNLLGRYRDTFEPLMNKFLEQAGSYNSEARQRFKMGEAESTVSQAMNAGADEAERKLQGFGIDPSSGRYQDQILASRIQRAAAMAGAGTQASVNTAAAGRQMTQAGAQMGQNVPGMTVNALGAGVNALTGAQGAMQGMLNTGANLTSTAAPLLSAAGAANHLPPVGNTSRAQNQSQQRSQSVEPSQGARGDQGGGGGNRGGNNQQPSSYRDAGQRPSAYPGSANPRSTPMTNQQPGSKVIDLGDGDNYWDRQDENGNPLYDPAAWDYIDRNQGQTPYNQPDWATNDTIATGQDLAAGGTGRPEMSWNDAPTMDDGNVFNGRQMGTSDQQTNVFDTSQRNQQVPFYDQSTPSVDPSNPWQGVGNPLDQEFTGSINQTNNYGDFDQGQNQGNQGNYGGDGWGNYDQGQQWSEPQDQGGQGGWDQGGGDWGGGGDNSNYQPPEDEEGSYGGYAKGGSVGVLPTGNRSVRPQMSPSRGQQTDDVPARLNVGEFVMPKDVVAHKGSEFFTNLIKKSRMARTGQTGPEPKPKMKPALRMRPQFVSDRV